MMDGWGSCFSERTTFISFHLQTREHVYSGEEREGRIQ